MELQTKSESKRSQAEKRRRPHKVVTVAAGKWHGVTSCHAHDKRLGVYVGCRQNYGPLLGPVNTRCHITSWTQKRTIILTTTHVCVCVFVRGPVSVSARAHARARECVNERGGARVHARACSGACAR